MLDLVFLATNNYVGYVFHGSEYIFFHVSPLCLGDTSNGMGCLWFTSRKCCNRKKGTATKLDLQVLLTDK